MAGAEQPAPRGGLRRQPGQDRVQRPGPGAALRGERREDHFTGNGPAGERRPLPPCHRLGGDAGGAGAIRQDRGSGGHARLPEFQARGGDPGAVPRHWCGAGPPGVGRAVPGAGGHPSEHRLPAQSLRHQCGTQIQEKVTSPVLRKW